MGGLPTGLKYALVLRHRPGLRGEGAGAEETTSKDSDRPSQLSAIRYHQAINEHWWLMVACGLCGVSCIVGCSWILSSLFWPVEHVESP